MVVADINADGAVRRVGRVLSPTAVPVIHVPADVSTRSKSHGRPRQWCRGIDYLRTMAIYGGMVSVVDRAALDYYKKFMSVNHDGVLVCTRAVQAHGQTAARLSIADRGLVAFQSLRLAKVGVNG